MKKLKIGLVFDDSLDNPDGVQQYIFSLSAWLKSQGHEVHYLVGETKRTDLGHIHSLSHNVKVVFNGNRMSIPLPASNRKIKKLLDDEKFDILQVQMPYSPFLAGKVIKLAPRSTVITTLFNILPVDSVAYVGNKLLSLAIYRTLKRVDRYYAVSPAAQKFARKVYGVDATVSPNMSDLARFRSGKPLRKFSGRPTILFLGRLVPRKGCQTLLEAAVKLHESSPNLDFQVLICGKGPLESSLKQYAEQHGIADKVVFAGFIDEKDKPDYLASATISVFPSYSGESFGIVLLEAMAPGRSVVLAGDNAGYSSVMNGLPDQLFSAKDSSELAAKLEKYLTDPELSSQVAKSQARYVRQFDTLVVGRQLESDFYKLLRDNSRP